MPLLEARYTLLLSACSMRLRYYIIQYVNTVLLPRKHLGTWDTEHQGIPSSLSVLDAIGLWDPLSCTFTKTSACTCCSPTSFTFLGVFLTNLLSVCLLISQQSKYTPHTSQLESRHSALPYFPFTVLELKFRFHHLCDPKRMNFKIWCTIECPLFLLMSV